MASTSTSNNQDPYLAELVQFSSRALLRKSPKRSPESHTEALHLSAFNWHDELTSETPNQDVLHSSPIVTDLNGHAQPLMPLRQRDLQALTGFFELEGMAMIEADIINSLRKRYPEPCWEDDPFDFLKEYL